MALGINKILAAIGSTKGVSAGHSVGRVQQPQAYKTAGYSSVPYEKAPKITDTVPTKYADGTPFWADYTTPNNVWVA